MMTTTTVIIEIANEQDIVRARRAGREMAIQLGFRAVDQSRITTAISELARNILSYAQKGEVQIHPLEEPRGIEVLAVDRGPGIANIENAMRDGYTSGRGLGIGLPGTRRLVDEMLVDSAPGKGTKVTFRKWIR
jgi:serine/threonine-protein kinase RsbT